MNSLSSLSSSLSTRLSPQLILDLVSPALSVAFVLLLPRRLRQLSRRPAKARDGWLGHVKLFASLLFLSLETAAAAFLSLRLGSVTHLQLVASVAAPVAALGLVVLSRLEHQRSARPSDLISVYLWLSLLCDVVHLTLPSLRHLDSHARAVLATRAVAKLVVLIVESLSKGPDVLDSRGHVPTPEERSGVFGRVLFLWVNGVLRRGYYNTALAVSDLPPIDYKLAAEPLRSRILQAWTQSRAPWLPRVLVKSLAGPFVSVVVPRLCVVIFRYAQPVLIRFAIDFAQSADENPDTGYLVVLAAIAVYGGLAASTAVYQHSLNRLQVMIRAALTGLMHERTLLAPSDAFSHGRIVALVTTDVVAVEGAAEMFHEIWARLIEVIVGTVLLHRQVGRLWPVPYIIIVACSQTSRYVAKHMKSRQTAWNVATQKRISTTTAALVSIKNIKMLGMQDAVERQMIELRKHELAMAGHVRRISFIYNASANALGMFTPVITIILFAVLARLSGRALDTKTAFPTIAVLGLVTHSANMVMTFGPRAVTAYASVERLQDSLQEARQDERIGPVQDAHSNSTRSPARLAISIKNLSIAWQRNGASKTVLDGVDLEVALGKIVVCSGPVGAGKTTLARAILGETPITAGTIELSTRRVAYCAQTPWLANKTIKEVIWGPCADVDETWYQSVTQACCLGEDLAALPEADGTVVGGDGMNLSGGQRQRVALARAVFQRYDVAILDDPFSALDGNTEELIVKNLLGLGGLFRRLGTTVFWITNSTHHFELVDHVIVLDGRIKEQGHWSQLKAKDQLIAKLIHHADDEQRVPGDGSKQATAVEEKVEWSSKTATQTSAETNRATGDLSLYGYYFASAGVANVAMMVTCAAWYSFFITFPQYWMKWWTDAAGSHTTFYVVGYALLYIMAWVSTNGIMWFRVERIAPISGLFLHKRLAETVLRAPLSYFSATDTGTILNHFSQDIQLVDKRLAMAVSTLGVQAFRLGMQASLIFAVQPIMGATLPLCAAIVYVVQKFYLRTTRQLRLLELESRSAVLTTLLDTSRGVETIRAFGWQRNMADEASHNLDLSRRPWYLLMCLHRWLNVVLDLLVAGLAISIVALSVALHDTTTAGGGGAGGKIGVTLTVILQANAALTGLIRSWTDLEVSLGAVARLRTVERDTPQDDRVVSDGAAEAEAVAKAWPSAGHLEIENLSASYNDKAQAFRDVTLDVAPGQTVVVCGRTGSGKSSLLLSLLGLLETQSGKVTVDGVDISRVPCATVRQRCFVTIAQDAFFLSQAALRFNLDSSGTLADGELVGILDKVGLWQHFASAETEPQDSVTENAHASGDAARVPLLAAQRQQHQKNSAVLDTPLASLPALSGGQAQLLALARGVAQSRSSSSSSSASKPIVLLDEATSSVDAATEAAMYDVVRDEFVGRGLTVLTVTHRLGAFAARIRPGRDVVVYMKDGRVENVVASPVRG
ncbi:P-loop containing nucleoside triphosphate hydrolase protein [Lasiosphaeria miniovina]|uniref:P-loop containing nucleoside triphosphate hydrolase protein n=1 Tax=Lasiosphaeria miniovina TaxID=1954250 RepID=A0AA40BGB6_9PEZI|nr:P-loop containing nucleoside triphosphate hydrolase protein [Lasiosphaeria miniovina]KAK0733418.1 P-loop containing nucleoside triphosphate hydrolase protein [Lasiosphaeria miniovina]